MRDRLLFVVVAVLFLEGCGGGGQSGGKIAVMNLPELPVVDTAALPAAVKTVIEDASSAARQEPLDAARVTRFGMVLQAHSQNAAAEACYARAQAIDPRRYDTLYYRAQVAEVRGDHKAAVEYLRQALALRPAWRPAKLALARELREAGDPRAAAEVAGQLIQADAGDATAYYLRGRATNSEADLRKALQLFPSYGAARFALANLYRQAGKQQAATAILRDYERDKLAVPPVEDPETAAVQALAMSAAVLLRRSQQAEAAGRLAEAAELQQQVIAMEPSNPEAWINLISLHARLGRDNEVESAYAKAVQIAPDRADAHYNYGVFCLQRNRFPVARAAFEKALAISPRHAEACMNLGGILANEGRLPEAAAMLRRAIAAKPGFTQARVELDRIEIFLRQKR